MEEQGRGWVTRATVKASIRLRIGCTSVVQGSGLGLHLCLERLANDDAVSG